MTKENSTDRLLEFMGEQPSLEIDHAFTVYLEPGRKLTHRETKKIRENNYYIQDIENGDVRTKVTLVKDND